MVVCNNNTWWNSTYNIIERVLQLQYYIDIFCTVNQRSSRRLRDSILVADINDDGSVRRDTLTSVDWDTLKKLFKLTKPFRDFTLWMEGCAKAGLYGAFWEVLPVIYRLVEEYKRYSAHYLALVLSNQYTEGENRDIEVNYLLISIYNALGKLYKYQELLSQSLTYAAAITMNLIFC